MKKPMIILVLLGSALFYGCATTPSTTYERGGFVKNNEYAGAWHRNEFSFALTEIDRSNGDCLFRVTKTEYRHRMVTPLYKQIKVTQSGFYDPNPGELLIDVTFSPLIVLTNTRPEGHRVRTERNETGTLIEGETRSDGFIKMSPEPYANAWLNTSINNAHVGKIKTTGNGIVRVPGKSVAEAYLLQKRVQLQFVPDATGQQFSYVLDARLLEDVLNRSYALGW